MNASLLPFFRPEGVVVVGASASPGKLGYGVARNLVGSGYRGAVHFVGQNPGELFGRQLYTDISQIPDPVDLAVLVVPAVATAQMLRLCAERGIHAAIIVSSGFRETGAAGAALEAECLAVARAHQIRLLGPNCIGTIDTSLPLDTSFLQPPMPPRGGIAFVSHSGAFCAGIVDWSRQQHIGFSQIVSLGNQADINETEMLPVVAEDEHTRVIVLYMEGVSDGVRFVETASEVARSKALVALKVGRFEAGQRAAASHTAALAASDTAFDAAFSKCGVLRATSTEEVFDWARALEVCPLPKGRRVAVLTDAGGPGVIASDALEMEGLELARLSDITEAALAAQLPNAASVRNPVDMLASASPQQYAWCCQALIEDDAVDALLIILPPPPMFTAESVADTLIPILTRSPKPAVVALLGSELTAAAFARFQDASIATYPFPERAASALAVLTRRASYLAAMPAAGVPGERPFHVETPGCASPTALLSAYGIRTVPVSLATSRDEAAVRAEAIGFPIVMKIASPDITHKSDAGGVILDIQDASQALGAYTKLLKAVANTEPGASVEGVYLQQQIPPGQDVIMGAIRDPHFGPLIMFGAGGIEVEGLKDVAFALPPVTEGEADDLISRTWAGRRLDGFRNIPPADRTAARDALIRLSWLVVEHPEITEIEINPLRVLQHGALALDVRAQTGPHSCASPIPTSPSNRTTRSPAD